MSCISANNLLHTDNRPPSSSQVLGHYLRRQRDPSSFLREIRDIASDPDERFFFNVTDEAALTDIVDALGDRIFGLEGNDYPGEMEDGVGGILE